MNEIFSSNPSGVTEILKNKKVFVAGAGGLGSNVCIMLARAGIGWIIVSDFDNVEASNLNRQQYFQDQIGMPKVTALSSNLLRINPGLRIEIWQERLTPENFGKYIPEDVDIIFECLDNSEDKTMLARFCLTERPQIPLIMVSGVAGVGPVEDISVSKGPGKMLIVGDRKTEVNDRNGTVSSRITQIAAIQCHLGIRLMLDLPVK